MKSRYQYRIYLTLGQQTELAKLFKCCPVVWNDALALLKAMCEAKANLIQDREVRVISQWEPTSQICSCCGYQWGKYDKSLKILVRSGLNFEGFRLGCRVILPG
ncbi:helix-turn-helix domain-containing protein [Spirulina sp. CCNP1310]|uniref:helix-turn-helix domain-containing protein n=1 Tax=Spirulina sp. CCNP1310 TaxID=3110249 RepID=UPI002B1ED1CE|nr:helix-turn-helix domain-containing protein [Spirulina sp. CCNP1310]MEA5420530.1 helix-turn-helix domain-containing protein [Spirulina sp. CCNP1310]